MSYMNGATFVNSPSKMPAGEHWAIIEFGSINIPGDLRSQQAPGHGYPEHTETTIGYTAFTNREDFVKEVRYRLSSRSGRKDFRAIHVEATVNLEPVFPLEEV